MRYWLLCLWVWHVPITLLEATPAPVMRWWARERRIRKWEDIGWEIGRHR